MTILEGGPDSNELVILFRERPEAIPLSLCYSEDKLAPLFDGGAWAGSMVWDGRYLVFEQCPVLNNSVVTAW